MERERKMLACHTQSGAAQGFVTGGEHPQKATRASLPVGARVKRKPRPAKRIKKRAKKTTEALVPVGDIIMTKFKGEWIHIAQEVFFNSRDFKEAYRHSIVDSSIVNKTLTMEDGLGKRFDVTWRWFIGHVTGAHKWTGDDFPAIFARANTASADVEDTETLRYEGKIVYGMFEGELKEVRAVLFFTSPHVKFAFQHEIVSVDNGAQSVTIVDGLGKQFDLGWMDILGHTEQEHKWVGNDFPNLFEKSSA